MNMKILSLIALVISMGGTMYAHHINFKNELPFAIKARALCVGGDGAWFTVNPQDKVSLNGQLLNLINGVEIKGTMDDGQPIAMKTTWSASKNTNATAFARPIWELKSTGSSFTGSHEYTLNGFHVGLGHNVETSKEIIQYNK